MNFYVVVLWFSQVLPQKVYESTTVYHVDTFQVMNQPEDMV